MTMSLSVVDLDSVVAAAQQGDRGAFAELVRRTQLGTYSLALRLTANEEDAHDVAQETYLRAFRALRTFRGDAQFTTWLYRITANCATTLLGNRSRHQQTPWPEGADLVDSDATDQLDGCAEGADRRERILAALAGLPPRLRAVVVLRDLYDLPHDAIASQLGISVSAAKVRLHRARLRLRTELSADRPDRWSDRDT